MNAAHFWHLVVHLGLDGLPKSTCKKWNVAKSLRPFNMFAELKHGLRCGLKGQQLAVLKSAFSHGVRRSVLGTRVLSQDIHFLLYGFRVERSYDL